MGPEVPEEPDSAQRASNLRAIALASAVALALALPLAFATAEPAAPGTEASSGEQDAPLPEAGLESQSGSAGPVARCGPELVSPEGVEAQTCVLTEGQDTWGRTYYRNGVGKPLHGVLTLLRPDGRIVQAPCLISASDEPGLCETPREPTVERQPGQEPYAAVAEVAWANGERKLLRAGSST